MDILQAIQVCLLLVPMACRRRAIQAVIGAGVEEMVRLFEK
jgi:hypothetical protein